MNAAGAIAFYMCFVYFTTYLRRIDLIQPSQALDANTLAIVVLLLLMVPMGALSDRIGRKPLLLAATLGMLLFAWPIFWLLHHPSIWVALIGQLGLAVLNACYWGPCTATLVELVPARLRCSVFSIGYNAGVGVLGGATPMLAVYTIRRTHDDLSPSVLLMAAAVVSISIILGLRESYRRALPGSLERSGARAAAGFD
jgi:MHS family proline/betaine transporter-like MFS transporter